MSSSSPSTASGAIPTSRAWLLVLRFGLTLAAVGWGISFFFTFAPWESASAQLHGMGAGWIDYDPMLDYWLRMASATFGGIGIAAALAALRPVFFSSLILLLGPFHLFVGGVLVVAAVRNGLRSESHPTFIADITFCFATAVLIMVPLAARRLGSGENGGAPPAVGIS